MKKRLLILLIFSFAFSKLISQSFEEIAEFGHYVGCSGPHTVNSHFTLGEINTYSNCDERIFRLSYLQPERELMKCTEFKYQVFSQDMFSGTINLVSTGTLGGLYAYTGAIVSTDFIILRTMNVYQYFLKIDYIGDCDMPCEYPHYTITSPTFLPNWAGVALYSNRHFNLDGAFSSLLYGPSPIATGMWNTLTKCDGDPMIFSITQDVLDDLHCYYSSGACANQYAGLKITKTDASHTPIESPKYLGTNGFASHYGVTGTTDFIQEDFMDYATGLTKDIPLLPLFSHYMDNNFGYYTLDFEYFTSCGSFIERMYIEYGTTYVPTFNFAEALTGGGFAINQVPTNTSFSNPFVSCQSSSILNLTNVSSNIYSNNPLNIIVERFDNTTGNSDGIVVDITFSNWAGASMVNLQGYASGNLTTPLNPFGTLLNAWSGIPTSLLLYLEPPFGVYPNITNIYPDNQDDIYNVRLEYTTICGTETAEMWFTPTTATCKKGIENKDVIFSTTKLFPNPTSNLLNIEYFSLDKNTTISIFNITGQKVLEKEITPNLFKVKEKLDISELTNGIYIMTLQTVSGLETHRFIKD